MKSSLCESRVMGSGHRLIVVAFLMVAVPGLSFGQSEVDRLAVHSGAVWVGSGWHAHHYSYPPPILAYPGVQWVYPCFPFVDCLVWQQHHGLDRRWRELRRQQPIPRQDVSPSFAEESMEAWRAGLRPPLEPFRTDERYILLEYRGHSLVRPEYEGVGSVRPEFPENEP